MGKVYVVGVGPGSPEFVTRKVIHVIQNSDIIVGYKHSLDVIRDLLEGKDVRQITLKTQENVYADVVKNLNNKTCVITFTGDPDFSESEIVDRLIEIFDDVEIIPGISSIQVAASKSKIPIDKSVLITFHITGDIEKEKEMLLQAIRDGRNVIMLPRPWDFMPQQVAQFLQENGVDINRVNVDIYEFLTLQNEKITKNKLSNIEDKNYSDLCVMVVYY
ncbi:MAG: precorrin-6y C5,15-methyltransferase (decarboxylating) subunit CbiE [Thaumarchaeota archaeon]|nr:precorrin-6y C5,15-methyltransferase (decarboxylating) subunit CbiE [Nitrososphaerota archaeon]